MNFARKIKRKNLHKTSCCVGQMLEKRLIDANTLRKKLLILLAWDQGASISWAEAYSQISYMIDDMPTCGGLEEEWNYCPYCGEKLNEVKNELY